MQRTILLACAAVLAAPLAARPAAAQNDPATRSLIEQLSPRAADERCPPGVQCRGLRVPTDATPTTPSPAAPLPVWGTPASPPSGSAALPTVPNTPPQTEAGAKGAAPPEATQPLASARVPTPAAPQAAPAVSITVTFGNGSAVLTPEAERALAPLGRALASPELAPFRFRIEGHTDAVGDPRSNQTLSERRAAAVRAFLQKRYGVAPARLEAAGFGDTQPVVATAPQVPEPRNRRVQVVNIGG